MKQNVSSRRRRIRPLPQLNNRQRSVLAGSLFFLPWLIGFLAITLYPLVYSVQISFNQVAIRPGEIVLEPVGFTYFRQAFLEDTEFPTKLIGSLGNILLGMPLTVVFALVISLLLSRKFRGRTLFRIIFFLPVIIMSGPVLSELMTETSAMSLNIDIMGLRSILMEMQAAGSGRWAGILLTFLNSFLRILWFCGVQIVVFLVALQKIDRNMYEAAAIDGASAWESFWKITLPYLRPIIMLNCIYTIVEMGAASDDATNAQIVDSIRDIARPYSYAAAQSWIFAFCLLLMIVVVFLIFRERKERGGRKS